MAVPAHAANNVTEPATPGHGDARHRDARHRDVRAGGAATAGTYPFEIGDQVITGWHSHELHQLEYAFEGVAQVETAAARYLLPPQQAAWIPAGVEHCTTLTRVRTLSVFFAPEPGLDAGERVRILAVAPVIREMILYARRWPIDRAIDGTGHGTGDGTGGDQAADAFFTALAHVLASSLDQEVPLRLPTSSDPLVAAAMDFTSAHLGAVALADVCAAAGTSERSLRRAFLADTGLTWREYLLQSRLLRAMALLAEPGRTVLAIATDAGFGSLSGFTRAFRRYTGETPLGYRQRVLPPR
jgi:AraC-like DNA-binding protein/quercetin dioxygenase-like cupin family protein